MLLGMYPPKKNNYVITEEQKYNAVPPVEGFDFKPWIDQMDLAALPFQTTIFPIQMNGHSYDYMLALDEDNCAAAKKARTAAKSEIDGDINKQFPKDAKLQALLQKHGWSKLCDYANWAYVESVDLRSEEVDDIDKLYSACQDAVRT